MFETPENIRIVLFDGICIFCISSINRIIKHDKKNKLKFATIQSETGKKLLLQYAINSSKTDSIIFIEDDKFFIKSTAILKITKHLDGIHSLAFSLIIIPAIVRDFIYDIFARNRYKWFGKKEVCMIPTEEIKSKFI